MTIALQDILKEYKSDMERMEHRIHESLGTDVALIRQVSTYILRFRRQAVPSAASPALSPAVRLP